MVMNSMNNSQLQAFDGVKRTKIRIHKTNIVTKTRLFRRSYLRNQLIGTSKQTNCYFLRLRNTLRHRAVVRHHSSLGRQHTRRQNQGISPTSNCPDSTSKQPVRQTKVLSNLQRSPATPGHRQLRYLLRQTRQRRNEVHDNFTQPALQNTNIDALRSQGGLRKIRTNQNEAVYPEAGALSQLCVGANDRGQWELHSLSQAGPQP